MLPSCFDGSPAMTALQARLVRQTLDSIRRTRRSEVYGRTMRLLVSLITLALASTFARPAVGRLRLSQPRGSWVSLGSLHDQKLNPGARHAVDFFRNSFN